MLNISKNIKKIALSLLVVGLAVGFSAFKSAENNKLHRFEKIYYHLGDFYVIANSLPEGYTCQSDTQPCSIKFMTVDQPGNDDPISENDLNGLTYASLEGNGSYQAP